jgi:hypothetical protein
VCLILIGTAQIAAAQTPPPNIPAQSVPPVYAATQGNSWSAASGQSVVAQSPWYIELSGGGIWRMDSSRSTTFYGTPGLGLGALVVVTGPGTNTVTFDPGYTFDFGLGYRLPHGLRVEVEGGYAHYTLSSVSPLNTNGALPFLNGNKLTLTSGGNVDQYAVTLNAFYDVPISGAFRTSGRAPARITRTSKTLILSARMSPLKKVAVMGGTQSSSLKWASHSHLMLNGRWYRLIDLKKSSPAAILLTTTITFSSSAFVIRPELFRLNSSPIASPARFSPASSACPYG